MWLTDGFSVTFFGRWRGLCAHMLLMCGGDIQHVGVTCMWKRHSHVEVTHVWRGHSHVGVTHMCGMRHQSEILHSLIF